MVLEHCRSVGGGVVLEHCVGQWEQGLIDPQSGERACNSAYACRDGKVLVVTKNRTLPFSKTCPNPPQKWAKTFS